MGAIAAAELTISIQLSMRPLQKMGLAVRSMAASSFERARQDLGRVLELAGKDLGSTATVISDEYGYLWTVVEDEDFPDIVAAAQVASQMLSEEGFSDQLLCAVFPFRDSNGDLLNFVYSFKRGNFYAFAPRDGNTRDTSLEIRAHALLNLELPLESELEYRYPLWGMPWTSQ